MGRLSCSWCHSPYTAPDTVQKGGDVAAPGCLLQKAQARWRDLPVGFSAGYILRGGWACVVVRRFPLESRGCHRFPSPLERPVRCKLTTGAECEPRALRPDSWNVWILRETAEEMEDGGDTRWSDAAPSKYLHSAGVGPLSLPTLLLSRHPSVKNGSPVWEVAQTI